MGSLILRWLRPSPTGPIDRETYRLRLVLAIQIIIFGIVTFLILSLAQSSSLLLGLPEPIAHIAVGLALWTNRVNWAVMLLVAGTGVAGMGIGDSNSIEIMFIFFVIPLVFPFYSSTRIALTTQILVWIAMTISGAALVILAPDRMPWSGFVVQIAAVALVGTLMVIFRFSLVQLVGKNQRLENLLAQHQMLYGGGTRAILVLSPSGHVREVHGDASRLLGLPTSSLIGKHYSDFSKSIVGPHEVWEAHLKVNRPNTGGTRIKVTNPQGEPASIQLVGGTNYQKSMGIALVAEIQINDAKGKQEDHRE